MDSTAFKYKQNQHFNKSSSNNNNDSIGSHNHNNQNSIFILNAETNNNLPNNPQVYYLDLNVNNAAPSFSSAATASTSSPASCTTGASSSVWSSASTTVCSPAAHAIQKLFNCSSNSLKLNHPNYNGIESNKFKSKSEILKKKSKFWKYLEGETNEQNNQKRLSDTKSNESKKLTSSFKNKSKYWSKSYESDNQNPEDIAELLEYSCRLCDDCRCMDCQIGYFDCEDSDDSNSEYSFYLNAYEEDEQPCEDGGAEMELKAPKDACCSLKASYEHCSNGNDQRSNDTQKIHETDTKLTPNCVKELNCVKAECSPLCSIEHNKVDGGEDLSRHYDTATNRDH